MTDAPVCTEAVEASTASWGALAPSTSVPSSEDGGAVALQAAHERARLRHEHILLLCFSRLHDHSRLDDGGDPLHGPHAAANLSAFVGLLDLTGSGSC